MDVCLLVTLLLPSYMGIKVKEGKRESKVRVATYGLAPSSNCKNVDTISSNKTSPSYTYLRISLDHTLPRPTKPLLHIGLQYWERRGD